MEREEDRTEDVDVCKDEEDEIGWGVCKDGKDEAD